MDNVTDIVGMSKWVYLRQTREAILCAVCVFGIDLKPSEKQERKPATHKQHWNWILEHRRLPGIMRLRLTVASTMQSLCLWNGISLAIKTIRQKKKPTTTSELGHWTCKDWYFGHQDPRRKTVGNGALNVQRFPGTVCKRLISYTTSELSPWTYTESKELWYRVWLYQWLGGPQTNPGSHPLFKVCGFHTESKILRKKEREKKREQYWNWIDEHRRLPGTFRPTLVVSATEHTSGESRKPYFVQSLCFWNWLRLTIKTYRPR